jgi:hypothetical protein
MIYIYEPCQEDLTFQVRAENRADAINRIKDLLDMEKEERIREIGELEEYSEERIKRISESEEYIYDNSKLREATAEESLEYLGLANIK